MIRQENYASRIASARRGYTMVEFTVAMTVLGIALSGLFPLLAILSRDLQPVRKLAADGTASYDCKTPARDGNTNGNGIFPPPVYVQHTWYLTSASDANTPSDQNVTAWVRKLGAGATITSGSVSSGPASFSPSIVCQNVCEDDDEATIQGTSWTLGSGQGYNGDYYYHSVPTDQNDPSLSDFVQWNLVVPANGWYSVQATWPTNTGKNLTTATYTVAGTASGTLSGQAFTVDQSNPPNGVPDSQFAANNVTWWPLTMPIQLTSGTITVTLGIPKNAATPGLSVIADAVRIVQNEVQVNSIERSLSGANSNSNNVDVTAHVSVTVNIPE